MMEKKQSQDIDRLHESLQNVTNSGKQIGDELDFHIKLLENTESSVDSTTIFMQNTSDRILKLADRSSNFCLILTIIILLLLIFLTLTYL